MTEDEMVGWHYCGGAWETEARKARDLGGGTGQCMKVKSESDH